MGIYARALEPEEIVRIRDEHLGFSDIPELDEITHSSIPTRRSRSPYGFGALCLSGSGAGGATGARSSSPQTKVTGSARITLVTTLTRLLDLEWGRPPKAGRDPESVAISMPIDSL